MRNKVLNWLARLCSIMFVLFNMWNLVLGSEANITMTVAKEFGLSSIYLPLTLNYQMLGNWQQIGHDAQRTNYTSVQVNPPYCYTWKWYEVPIASRTQPVVANGRLFVGGMDGKFYSRDASTGAPIWEYPTGGPVRHSAGVYGNSVIFSSHDGFTYSLNAENGNLYWKSRTGKSATAPLIDDMRKWVYVASTDGTLYALNMTDGAQMWKYDSGAPVLTSPTLSTDYSKIFIGNEAIYAIAINPANGNEIWRTRLEGQSLADRYPVVINDKVLFRSQPLYNFHVLLHEGDSVMDRAGSVDPEWDTDWEKVRAEILNYLSQEPGKQTFFVLNQSDGTLSGIAPVLYAFGNNDIPNVPVIRNDDIFVTYRARHGIQTDTPTVHVTTKYDAELGILNEDNLDIDALHSSIPLGGPLQFRMTSDEPAMLSMGGSILFVDNWERLGGINVETKDLVHVGGVSNDWPECGAQCGPGTNNPFFPLSGSPSDQAYPFPSPRVTEGKQRSGVVIANGMIYWHVIEGGLAGISHRAGESCPVPIVWTGNSAQSELTCSFEHRKYGNIQARPLEEYVTLDLTNPVINPDEDLINRLRKEVQALVTSNDHLTPFYIERGFTTADVWPYNTEKKCTSEPCLPNITYGSNGNAFWHDPGELLYSLALAYPYLDEPLQILTNNYMASEINKYPPLEDLPYNNDQRDWLRDGANRELYKVSFRSDLNSWPPPAVNLSVLYSLWLWSKNTGDWSYAQNNWDAVRAVFEARKDTVNFYADISGILGFARMAQHFGYSADFDQAEMVALNALQAGLDFDGFKQRANYLYLDPPKQATGWSVPVFYGLVPEIGLYLREQTSGKADSYLLSKENGDGMRWWFLTRAGIHAEDSESSYLAPTAAWSHFLAHAYLIGDPQANLRNWLDRPWGIGDLYSIQKLVATIQSPP